jgi:hypothetical protein
MPILDGRKISNHEALAWWLSRPASDVRDNMIKVTRRAIREENRKKRS